MSQSNTKWVALPQARTQESSWDSATPSCGLSVLMEQKKRIVHERFYMLSLKVMYVTFAYILLPRKVYGST